MLYFLAQVILLVYSFIAQFYEHCYYKSDLERWICFSHNEQTQVLARPLVKVINVPGGAS